MTAQINIHLAEGLTGPEIGEFVEESQARKVPVEIVLTEVLRSAAQRMRKKRLEQAQRDTERAGDLLGLRRPA